MVSKRVSVPESHPYVPPWLAVKAMRDNGYKNTAYALAELIDNSYQAIESVRATDNTYVGQVDVVVVEGWEDVGQRKRRRPQQMAVVDNGCGMNAAVLRKALQFGNGGYLDNRSGIGRFGMGLPNSTISQCLRADVYTWQKGVENALYSFLDLRMMEVGELVEVPEPTRQLIPKEWFAQVPMLSDSESGTIVIWSSLDRVNWRTAASTLDNTEQLIGRLYRKLIQAGLQLNLVTISDSERAVRKVRPNDPLYLMTGTSTPAPFDAKPMFRPYGQHATQTFPVLFRGETHEVAVTLSYATDEARVRPDGKDAGGTAYGKHARTNEGISIVRADRELNLDTSWTSVDPRERWWGAEVAFPAALDEVFGVTNNKQYATNFTQMTEYYQDSQSDEDWQEIRREWEQDDDPRRHLVDICNSLFSSIQGMRSLLRIQTQGNRTPSQKRHDDVVESTATAAFKERAEQGHSATRADDNPSPAEKQATIETSLVNMKYRVEDARNIAEIAVSRDLRVIFVKQEEESPSFFRVAVEPGVTEVVFNTSHPAYDMLISTLDPASEDESPERLRERVTDASRALKLLLAAWARFEAEEKYGERRDRLVEIRQDWGRMAKSFLKSVQTGATHAVISDDS